MKIQLIKSQLADPYSIAKCELLFHCNRPVTIDVPISYDIPPESVISLLGKSSPIIINDFCDLPELTDFKNLTSVSISFYSDCFVERNLELPSDVSLWITPLENNPYATPILSY